MGSDDLSGIALFKYIRESVCEFQLKRSHKYIKMSLILPDFSEWRDVRPVCKGLVTRIVILG